MSLFRVIREEDLNINKIFHTILVEINKYENNVDLRKLGCKKLFEFFIKNERCLLSIFYLCVILNCLLCITYIFFGFFIRLRVKSKGNDYNLNVDLDCSLAFGISFLRSLD